MRRGTKHRLQLRLHGRALMMSLAASLAMLPFAAMAEEAASADAARLSAARAAVKDLGETLKGQLMAAIKSGGPASALPVCKTIAPAAADESSKAHTLSIRRTALKIRNSNNAPDEFERRVLEDFAAKIAAGTDPATLEHAETVTVNGTPTWRYMKAIPMAAEPCTACHGTSIKPELKAEIDNLYPHDQATGFKPGELRGAFSVSMPVK